ncbi:MAG: hypothetical protein RRY53_05090, partial [Pseudoflavonifractor sp.]
IYFHVQAPDGSIEYYVVEMRNSNTENLNLDYRTWETPEGPEKSGFALWAYDSTINDSPSIKPNGEVVYRSAQDPASSDKKTRKESEAQKLPLTAKGDSTVTTMAPVPWTYATDAKGDPVVQDVYGKKADGTIGIVGARYIPTYFVADIGQSITSVRLTAVAEYKYSGVAIERRTTGTQPNPNYEVGQRSITLDGIGTDADVFVNVYVRSQNEQQTGGQGMFGRTYTVELNHINDACYLGYMEVVGDEANLNPTKKYSTAETTVDVTVAAATEEVSLQFVDLNEDAYVSMYKLDPVTGNFKDTPMEFYIKANYDAAAKAYTGNYNWNAATSHYDYVAAGNGEYNRVVSPKHILGSTFV